MTPRETALIRAEQGREIAAAVRDAIHSELPADAETLAVASHRIQLCNSTNNIWFANDLHNADGELYNGSGRFWSCYSKLCPECVAKQSRRNRAHLRTALALTRLHSGEYRNMITLTIPKTDLPLLKVREIVNHAWKLFSRRAWFKKTFVGGAKSEEFTVTPTGFHYHIHTLAQTKYILYASLRHHWTECCIAAFAKAGHPLTIATSDGLADCHVRRISSIDAAIKEVAKYITKADSWAKIKQSDLLDLLRIRKFPRMFELFGSFRVALKEPALVDAESLNEQDYLDTQCLILSDRAPYWRDAVRLGGASAYLVKIGEQYTDAFHFRREALRQKYPYANFTRPKPLPEPSVDHVMQLIAKVKRARFGIADHTPGKVLHGFGRSIDLKAIAALDPDRFN